MSDDTDLLTRAVLASRAAADGDEVVPLEVELRDGSRVLLRPIRPDDKERLRQGLQWLSPRSRHLGFHAALDHLTEAQLRYVTEIDHRDHVAWVVDDPRAPDVPGIAIARYIRIPHAPEVAEAAIAVIDDYQARGLGTVLLGVLAAVAVDNDIRALRNYVLAENETVLDVFEQLGASRQVLTPGVYEVDLSLPMDPDELAASPAGRALRALAGEATDSHLALTIPPLWLHRRRRRQASHPPATPPAELRERGPFGDWLDQALAPPPDDEVSGG